MSILSKIANIYYSGRNREIDYFINNPLEIAELQFKYIVEMLSTTKYGKERGLKSLTKSTYQDFHSKIPIVTYEDISTEIEAVMSGDWERLCPSKPRWYAKSSGTTNAASKYIPTTEESLKLTHYRGLHDTLAIYIRNNPEGKAFNGKILTLGGSLSENSLGGGGVIGDLSGILITNNPSFAELKRFPSNEISLSPNFEQKIEIIAKKAAEVSVSSFAGVPSWYLVLMNKILDYNGKSSMCEIWPEIDLFVHGGMSFTPYREEYNRIFPTSDMKYIETYNASEGFFSIQDDPDRDDMILMLDNKVFYEFLDCNNLDKHEKAIPLEGVEVGTNYALIISTPGGLWRYMIGDTVTFTSVKPYRIKVTGRTKHFINIAGEEVIIDNATTAIQEACIATGARITDYTAAPIYMSGRDKGAHEWVFEFMNLPNSLDRFTSILDNTIQRINSDYKVKRSGGALNPPRIVTVKSGTFYKWMKSREKLGGQNKIPRLSNNRQYIDSLLKIAKGI